MSSRCCLKDFTARRRRTNSENKKGKERRGTGEGHAQGYSWSRLNSIFSILILLPWAFFLSPFTPRLLSYSPTLCSLPTLFTPPSPTQPLSSCSLSLHPFGGTVLLIMPVIGVTHTFPVCLDQIKNIVSILPTWPLLAELNGLCSVLSAAN